MSQEITHANAMSTTDLLSDPAKMQALVSFADMMSKSGNMVPDHFKGKPSDCMAILMQAARWGMDPFAVAQGTHIVSGTLGYEAKLVNAVISSSTAIEGRFHYRYNTDEKWVVGTGKKVGPDAWVQVGAILKCETEIQWGERLYPDDVTTKNSPLWQTNPKMQSGYLAVKYWARMYCPHVMLGIHTSDEILDNPQYSSEKDITPDKPESALRRPDQEAAPIEGETEPDQKQQAREEAPDYSHINFGYVMTSLAAASTIDELAAIGVEVSNSGKFEDGSSDHAKIKSTYKEAKAALLRAQDAENAKL